MFKMFSINGGDLTDFSNNLYVDHYDGYRYKPAVLIFKRWDPPII